MAQYLLSVHMLEDENPFEDEAQMNQAFQQVEAYNQDLRADGTWVFAGGLQPADIATVVRAANGEVVTTDGPFAETKEHIGGFWIIDVPDLDAALASAAKASAACMGPVEVRPFQVDPGA